MVSLRKEIQTRFIIISVIPIFLISLFSFYVSTRLAINNYAKSSTLAAKKMSDSIDLRVATIEQYYHYIRTDAELSALLRNTNFADTSYETYRAEKRLDRILNDYFGNNSFYEGSVFFNTSANAYMHNLYIQKPVFEEFLAQYDFENQYIDNIGGYSRIGNAEFLDNDKRTILFWNRINDVSHLQDGKYISTIYTFFNEELFYDCLQSDTWEDADNIRVALCDRTGRIIAQRDTDEPLKDLWEYGNALSANLNQSASGFFKHTLEDRKNTISHFTSPVTGWTVMICTPINQYFSETYSILFLDIFVMSLFILLVLIMLKLSMEQGFSQINKIVEKMARIGEGSFDVRLPDDSKYVEISQIVCGFNTMTGKMNHLINHLLETKQKKKQAEITALRYQINPHFLHNILGAISMAAQSNGNERISQMLLLLGRFLRNTLSSGTAYTTLKNEINNIKDYIALQNILHNGAISTIYNTDPAADNFLIPSMLIQPSVENAIKHGLNERFASGQPAIIEIRTSIQKGKLYLDVYDNGIGIEAEKIKELLSPHGDSVQKANHIGIYNISERIKQEFGDAYGLELKSVPGEFTMVSACLPIMLKKPEEGTPPSRP